MSKRQAKAAINKIDTDLNSTNLVSTGTIVNSPSNALLLALNPSNDFFLDQENKDKIIKISEDFTIKQTNLQQQADTLNARNTDLLNELANIAGITTNQANTKRLTIATEQATITGQLATITTMLGNIGPRQAEYQALAGVVNEFDLERPLPDMKNNTYNCGPDFMAPGATANTFNFYNKLGGVINLANYYIDIKLADGTIQNVRINGLGPIIAPNGTINVTGITFTDRAGAVYAPTQGYEFTLNPGAIRTIGGREFISSKPLKVVRGPVGALNMPADRATEVDACNNAGAGNIIKNSMDSLSATSLAKREREAIFRAIANKDGPKFDKLSNEQKEDMYQVARRLIKPPTGASPLIPATNLTYDQFKNWVTGDKHPSNAPENILNPMAYRNYINNNLETLIPEFFARQMDKEFIDDIDRNTFLKSEVTRYLSEIERQKVDTDVHQNVLGDIDAVDEMENTRRFGRLGRRDKNYLSRLEGEDSKVDIKDQTVNITTNNRPEDLNNPEPVKYAMNMQVKKQQIEVNIKIEGNKEIPLKGGNPAAIVSQILKCEDIQHGKVRAHIVYNIIKGLIQTAKNKDISLTYRDPGTGDMMVIKMDGKNVVLEQQDDHTNAGGTHRRNTTVLFDHKYFENTNTFESAIPDDNRSLRIGIDKMMGHFNFAMNEGYHQYKQATERRWIGLRRGETKMTLPTSFWLSPIKKIINLNTTTKFDFSTNAQANGKSVNIEFKNNKFTLNMAGLKKPISSRTLGKLLRHRQGGVRVFDGMEREICGKVYEELIKKMRENSKVARTNFGVKDCITGRTYILDADGQLGYINAEQAATDPEMIRKGRLSKREYGIVDNPPEGRRLCDESEKKEVMKNPFLMGRLIKTMNNRMGIISSTRALLN